MAECKRDALNRLYRHDERVAPWAGTGLGVVQAVNTYAHHEGTRAQHPPGGAEHAPSSHGRLWRGRPPDRHPTDRCAVRLTPSGPFLPLGRKGPEGFSAFRRGYASPEARIGPTFFEVRTDASIVTHSSM